MVEMFEERAERLSRMDMRALVGLALNEALPEIPQMAALYADVGRRFNLDDYTHSEMSDVKRVNHRHSNEK